MRDQSDAALPGTQIILQNQATATRYFVMTDSDGYYQFIALPIGTYRVSVSRSGFQTLLLETVELQVGQAAWRDFTLTLGDVAQEVRVTSALPVVNVETAFSGTIIDRRTVQEIPLRGRYFLDLANLVPGSVVPPQGAFSAAPIRGLGSLAINTAGNREEGVSYLVNGITLNDLAYSSITFQPSIDTIREFKLDNSTFSAEYGHSSGAVVNIVTRSGGNAIHGSLFEFLRNDALDARNFFTFTSSKPQPYKRNQFGANLGGPIVRDRTFFFFSWEAVRQAQQLDLNSVVPTQMERASVRVPAIASLLQLVPDPNLVDEGGTSRFIGSAAAPITVDQWTVDASHHVTTRARLHVYYAVQRALRREPTVLRTSIPGFGSRVRQRSQLLTLNEVHTFSNSLVNNVRLGVNRFFGVIDPEAQLEPSAFQINNGVVRAGGLASRTGLPQFSIAGGALTFGGPAGFPIGRGDTTVVAADTLSYARGNHLMKFGGEFRRFLNNNFRSDSGSFNFATMADFLAGTANSFTISLGERTSSISQSALGLFAQENFRWRRNLTLDIGLRYEWHPAPAERHNRFVVFDPLTVALYRVGTDIDRVYRNNSNIEPRVGIAWAPFENRKTSVRAAYGVAADQPMTSVVHGTTANPPVAVPLTIVGAIPIASAITLARPAGLSPETVHHRYRNARLQSWNVSIQRELVNGVALVAGYFGSRGKNLRLSRNINQPIGGTRPYSRVSAASPITPEAALGNITQVESSGRSTYNGLWLSASQRLTRGLQFNASYTWSKSIDYNSLSTQGVVVQNSYDIRGDRGLSDYDARHRFVISGLYDLPFRGNRIIEAWRVTAIVQSQSGSPINIVAGDSTVNGVANTLRPDVSGPIAILGRVEQWFATDVFVPVPRFGNLGRNVVIGPRFENVDVAVSKEMTIGEQIRVQLRAECFNLLNHANLGPPGRVAGGANFGVITSTRFQTGEPGSSRQIQFALKLFF